MPCTETLPKKHFSLIADNFSETCDKNKTKISTDNRYKSILIKTASELSSVALAIGAIYTTARVRPMLGSASAEHGLVHLHLRS